MIHRLKYIDKEQAENHLTKLGIIDGYKPTKGVSVIWLGKMIAEKAEYDNDGNVTKEAVFIDGYHVDVVCDVYDFGEYEINPNTPKHVIF